MSHVLAVCGVNSALNVGMKRDEMNNCFVAILENRFFSGNMSTHLCEYSFLYCLTVNFSSSNCFLLRNSI